MDLPVKDLLDLWSLVLWQTKWEEQQTKLIELAKSLSIPNFNCICNDELNAQIINLINGGLLNCPLKVLLKQILGHQGLGHTSPTNHNCPINLIVNLNDTDKHVNGHWCLCFIDNEQNIYHSFYGDPIPIEVKKYMIEVDYRLILSSNFQIQELNEDTCGLYCILILILLNDKLKFEDIIISFV